MNRSVAVSYLAPSPILVRADAHSCVHMCIEVYSTGRANLPGSVVERQLQASWYRMMPELLRYSSSSRLLTHIPDEVQQIHRRDAREPVPVEAPPAAASDAGGLWDGWKSAGPSQSSATFFPEEDDGEDLDLTDMGIF